jgi:hypothetical protein
MNRHWLQFSAPLSTEKPDQPDQTVWRGRASRDVARSCNSPPHHYLARFNGSKSSRLAFSLDARARFVFSPGARASSVSAFRIDFRLAVEERLRVC